jgi:anthranilate synthase component 2
LLDNYDSFTFNLVHYLAELGADVEVVHSDAITPGEAMAGKPDGFLISPGPGRPQDAGHSLALVEACAATGAPLLGVCLGHQAIAMHFGCEIRNAPEPRHGKTDLISHDSTGLFVGIESPFEATRYHSLAVDPETISPELTVNAISSDGVIQGIRHRHAPIHGVQFHPESAATRFGHQLIKNFLDVVCLSRPVYLHEPPKHPLRTRG